MIQCLLFHHSQAAVPTTACIAAFAVVPLPKAAV